MRKGKIDRVIHSSLVWLLIVLDSEVCAKVDQVIQFSLHCKRDCRALLNHFPLYYSPSGRALVKEARYRSIGAVTIASSIVLLAR